MLFEESIRMRASACAPARQRKMHGHLVAVEVRVVRRADERMQMDRFAFDQHRLEGLNAETMERRCAVEQHRMLA